MRADRLLSILILLQTRGRMTAKALAEELEVSERTIYRDMVALSTAGVPVYTERGPGGGCTLLDSYRTDLTGLSTEEVRALFMLSIPAPLAELGVGQELKAALLKLTAALPATGRQEQIKTQQRIHLDSSWWFQPTQATPHLRTLQQALWQTRPVQIAYRGFFNTLIEKLVRPYGLVAKANVWYLVWGNPQQIDVVRVANLNRVMMTDKKFDYPLDFDLAAFWTSHCQDYEKNRPFYTAQLRLRPELIERLPEDLRAQAQPQIRPTQSAPDEWIELELRFRSFEEARMHLLNWGNAAEVLAPHPLRESVLDFAQQVVAFYGEG